MFSEITQRLTNPTALLVTCELQQISGIYRVANWFVVWTESHMGQWSDWPSGKRNKRDSVHVLVHVIES